MDLLISANILAKRLNFAINPDILPKEEFVVAIEKACCTMEEGFQNEVLGTLRQAKCPQSNLTVEEQQALSDLKKQYFDHDPSIGQGHSHNSIGQK